MQASPTTDGLPATPAPTFTDDEALALTIGADYWTSAGIPRLGVQTVRMSDGPHGLRRQRPTDAADHLGLSTTPGATCFPPAVTLASTWDAAAVAEIAVALAREARAAGVQAVLGPGINIKRSPLGGRNFEYFSEDPLLSGILGGAVVSGLQREGVAACVKHYAANNQETDRMAVSSDLDERTLHEIYLRAFERIVRHEHPWMIMSSYNRVNGITVSEHRGLLTETLRDDWGWDGVVVSDWGAVTDRVESLNAGLDLAMPHPGEAVVRTLAEAHAAGRVEPVALAATAARVALLSSRVAPVDSLASIDEATHHALVARVAADGAVLLENRNGALPLDLDSDLAIVGALAADPRYQGAGSSRVTPTRVTNALDELRKRLGRPLPFAPGYRTDGIADDELVRDAVRLAREVDTVILVVGLPDGAEAEGSDRGTLSLPADQLALIRALTDTSARVVVCLVGGSVLLTHPWADDVDALVEFWLTGQAHGEAIAAVLTGDVPPAGRLAETIPLAQGDEPSALMFPGELGHVRYGEGILVGYRGYDAANRAVAYPFGHGLSYTSFEHQLVRAESTSSGIVVTATVRNTGNHHGREVVQVYASGPSGSVFRPVRELVGFAKTRLLAPGEAEDVTIEVAADDLAYWHPSLHRWVVETGTYCIAVGSSSRDLPFSASVAVDGEIVRLPLDLTSTFGEWLDEPDAGRRLEELIAHQGGLSGRVGELSQTPAGLESIRTMPLRNLAVLPGFPADEPMLVRLLAEL